MAQMNIDSSASEGKPTLYPAAFWSSMRNYPFETYRGIPLGELAAYAIGILSENRVDCSYENLTVVLFKLFPEKFSLVGFREFPDGDRVSNTIRLDARH